MRIYFDHNATTPPDPAVVEAVARALQEDFGNAVERPSLRPAGQGRCWTRRGPRSADLIGAEPAEVVFTSGGTEADNLALRGAAEALEPTGRRHLIASSIEHEAVLNTVKALARRGWTVDAAAGRRHRHRLARGARGGASPIETALVSVMHANNEIGTIQPIARARGRSRTRAARCSTPTPCSRSRRFRSTCGRSASTCCRSRRTSSTGRRAPARCGSSAARGWCATMTGGKHERNRRAGTENVPGLAGLGVAARLARQKLATEAARLAALRDRLEQGILGRVPGTVVNGARDAARAEHDEHQLRRRRGRVAADRARPRRLRRVDRVGVLVGHARAVARAARDGAARAPDAELDPLQPRRRQHRRRGRRVLAKLPSSSTKLRLPVAALRTGRQLANSLVQGRCNRCRLSSRCPAASTRRSPPRCSPREGHDVIGLSMQLYDQHADGTDDVRFGSCCTLDDLYDARRVARSHRHPPLHRQFRAAVRGARRVRLRPRVRRRPDADPVRALQRRPEVRDAASSGPRAFERRRGRDRPLRARRARSARRARYRLLRGVDRAKDQSYFLFTLTQAQLARAQFPVGALDKAAVRDEARRLGLSVAEKPDSQEICFVPAGDARGVRRARGRHARRDAFAIATGTCSARTRRAPVHRSDSGRGSGSRRRSRSTSSASTRRAQT